MHALKGAIEYLKVFAITKAESRSLSSFVVSNPSNRRAGDFREDIDLGRLRGLGVKGDI